jgi:hypothetical protein
MNGKAMVKTTQFFKSQAWRLRRSHEEPILMIMDNLQSHINNPAILMELLNDNIHPFTVIPNSTDVTQLNDQHFNSAIRAHLKTTMQISAEIARSLGDTLDYQAILRAGMDALDLTCRASSIKHCFSSTYCFTLVCYCSENITFQKVILLTGRRSCCRAGETRLVCLRTS